MVSASFCRHLYTVANVGGVMELHRARRNCKVGSRLPCRQRGHYSPVRSHQRVHPRRAAPFCLLCDWQPKSPSRRCVMLWLRPPHSRFIPIMVDPQEYSDALDILSDPDRVSSVSSAPRLLRPRVHHGPVLSFKPPSNFVLAIVSGFSLHLLCHGPAVGGLLQASRTFDRL